MKPSIKSKVKVSSQSPQVIGLIKAVTFKYAGEDTKQKYSFGEAALFAVVNPRDYTNWAV